VLVDDHTRYKFVRFLKKKSDALKEMRLFVASFNAKLNVGNSAQARSVGSLKLDNAGEFLSHQFKTLVHAESSRRTRLQRLTLHLAPRPSVGAMSSPAQRWKALLELFRLV
jgi:hypothetical protein